MRFITAVVVVIGSTVGAAHAEELNVPQGLDTQKLARVFVDTKAGEEFTGRLVKLDGHNITLLVDAQTIDVPFENVKRVQRAGDSVRNGARIGALAFGLWCAYICRQSVPGIWPYAVVSNALVGAGLGAVIDSAIPGRTTVYTAPLESGTAPAAPRPFARLSFRF